jgi:hypothetical protein
MACLIFFFCLAPTDFMLDEYVIFFAVPQRVFGCGFKLGIRLISDARRATAEVNSENKQY